MNPFPFVQLFANRLSSHLSCGYPLLISRARSLRLQSTKSNDGIALAQLLLLTTAILSVAPLAYARALSGSTIDLTVAGSLCRPSPYQSSSILSDTLSHTLELYPYVYNRPIGRWLLLSPLSFTVEFYPYVYNRPIGRWLYSPCSRPSPYQSSSILVYNLPTK